MKSKYVGYTKLVLVVLIWGGVYHVAKYLVEGSDPFTVSFVRWFIASVVLLAFYWRKCGVAGFKKSTTEWKVLLLLSLFGVSVYNLLFFSAEVFLPASMVAILYSFTPCITVMLSAVFLKQKVSFYAWCGIIVAMTGAVVVINLSSPTCGKFFCIGLFSNVSFGQILAILASLSMAIYTILNKQASHMQMDSLTITTFSAVFGAIVLFITAIFFGDLPSIIHKSWMFWLAMAYVSTLATVVSYKWYSEAICNIGMNKTSVFQNGIPLATVILGVVFLGQTISLEIIMSGCAIIAGVLITNKALSQ